MGIDAGESEATPAVEITLRIEIRGRAEQGNKTCPCKEDNIGRSLCEKKAGKDIKRSQSVAPFVVQQSYERIGLRNRTKRKAGTSCKEGCKEDINLPRSRYLRFNALKITQRS
jgi:hypothetical protein